MEAMYLKYVNGKVYSIIKENGKIIIDNSRIIPIGSIKRKTVSTPCSKNNKVKLAPKFNDIDEEITNYFLDSIHKNYLLNRKK